MDYSPPGSCEIEKWALGGTITTNDGDRLAIADENGLRDSTVTSTAAGVKLTFNGVTKTGTAEIASAGCLAY